MPGENHHNYKDLVRGVIGQWLKPAFRIYVHAMGFYQQTTSQYVRHVGATWCQSTRRPPYLGVPGFQAEFESFLEAFVAEYDNPARVDYIEGNALGWGGDKATIFDCRPGEVVQKSANLLLWVLLPSVNIL